MTPAMPAAPPPAAAAPPGAPSLGARVLHELKAGGKKTAVLGGLSLVGLYVWSPKLKALVGRDANPAAPAETADAGVPAPTPATPDAPAESVPAVADAAAPLDAAAVFARLADDPRLRPVGTLPRDPFTPPAAPEPAATAAAAVTEDAPPAAAPDAAEVAALLPLAGTLGSWALFARRPGDPVPVGGVVEAGGHRFRLNRVAAGSAELVWLPGNPDEPAGPAVTYDLAVPAPAASAAFRPARTARATPTEPRP